MARLSGLYKELEVDPSDPLFNDDPELPHVHLYGNRTDPTKARNAPPPDLDNKAYCLYLQLVLRTHDWRQIYKALHVLDANKHLLDVPSATEDDKLPADKVPPPRFGANKAPYFPTTVKKEYRHRVFWSIKLNQAVEEAIKVLRRKGSGNLSEEQKDFVRPLGKLQKAKEDELGPKMRETHVREPRAGKELMREGYDTVLRDDYKLLKDKLYYGKTSDTYFLTGAKNQSQKDWLQGREGKRPKVRDVRELSERTAAPEQVNAEYDRLVQPARPLQVPAAGKPIHQRPHYETVLQGSGRA